MSIIGTSALIIMLVAAFLILNPRYNDGFSGRTALAILFVAGLVIQIGEITDPERYDYVPLEFEFMLVAIVIFLVRHVVRVIWFTRDTPICVFNERKAKHGDILPGQGQQ